MKENVEKERNNIFRSNENKTNEMGHSQTMNERNEKKVERSASANKVSGNNNLSPEENISEEKEQENSPKHIAKVKQLRR